MKKSNSIVQVVLGAVIAIILSVGAAAVAATLINAGKLSPGSVRWIALLINGVSALLGSVVGIGTSQMKPLIAGLSTAGLYLIWLLLSNWTIADGFRAGWGYAVLAVITACAIAILLVTQTKTGRKRYR